MNDLSHDALLSRFLYEVGQHPLLTAEDEIRLAKIIERGREARRQIEEATNLSRADLRRLRKDERDAEAARDEFVNCNLRLVVSIAKKNTRQGMELLDLIQEGNIGLMKAVERFDWRKGFKFSTYATWWIRQGIQRGFQSSGRTIKLPTRLEEALVHVRRAVHELERDGNPVTTEQIADVTGLEPEEIDLMLAVELGTVSLNSTVSDRSSGDSDTELEALIADRTVEDPMDAAIRNLWVEHLARRTQELSDTERRVVFLRVGVDDHPKSLKVIAADIGITHEQARTLDRIASAKMQHPARLRTQVHQSSQTISVKDTDAAAVDPVEEQAEPLRLFDA